MQRTGIAHLKLHYGKAPPWLFNRMVRLGRSIMTVIHDDLGSDIILERISDPFFFQSLSNVLGFDWNSSGTTTVLCGVLETVFNEEELGLRTVGGKGSRSRETPNRLVDLADEFSLNENKLNELRYASRMSAKVDSSAIQANYQLYHHCMFVSEKGKWTIVQQGMNSKIRAARRYHWLSNHVKDFVEEPHNAIVGDIKHDFVLDLTSKESRDCRDTITDLSKEPIEKTKELFMSIKPGQRTLREWLSDPIAKNNLKYIVPSRMNWNAAERAHQLQVKNFENLLNIDGIGPATIRGLALISDLIYGDKPSWKDPVKYSFAFGGKDGVPFPVKRKDYDRATDILESAIKESKLGYNEKIYAIKRLKDFVEKADLIPDSNI